MRREANHFGPATFSPAAKARTARSRAAGCPTARGMSLLEVALATTLLGIASAMIFSAVGQMWAGQQRQQQTLGAAEVANRLILQYLDDFNQLPRRSAPIPYGGYSYRWSLREEDVELQVPSGLPTEVMATLSERRDRSNRSSPKSITVHVWLSEEQANGGITATAQTPEFVLTRLMDPMAPRNPDTFRKIINDPNLINRYFGGGR